MRLTLLSDNVLEAFVTWEHLKEVLVNSVLCFISLFMFTDFWVNLCQQTAQGHLKNVHDATDFGQLQKIRPCFKLETN